MNKNTALRALLVVISLGAGFAPAAAQAANATATSEVFEVTSSTNLLLSNNQYYTDASTPFQSQFDAGTTLQSYFFSTTQGGSSSYASLGPNPFGASGEEPTTSA